MLALRAFALVVSILGLLATPAAAQQLYKGSWIAESFGNDVVGGGAGADESDYFSVFGMPQGLICNPYIPVCTFNETPVDATGNFNPLGPNCLALTAGQLPRPAKGGTVTKGVPPLYRNPSFFTAGGGPKTTSCTAFTTVSGLNATAFLTTNDPARGPVMKGAPLTGYGKATTTGPADPFGFKIPAAPATSSLPGMQGMRRTTLGEFNNIPPYLYSYTYATLRNDVGTFAEGGGFFSTGAAATAAQIKYKGFAQIDVKKGANNFGGVMKLLGKLSTRVCYFYAGGCSLGGADWHYQDIGAPAYKAAGVVTAGFTTIDYFYYYNTALQAVSYLTMVGERFPWTTGKVTLTATGRGPHNTIQVRKGADNRVSGVGTVQLVSPILTHWLGAINFETGGIAILKLEFLPEPSVLAGLVAGLSLLWVGYRARGR